MMREMKRWFTRLLVVAAVASVGHADEWTQLVDPSATGWSGAGLEQAKSRAEAEGSAAVMVVQNGLVVAAWGQIDRPFPLFSMRKGMYNVLVGTLVDQGKIDLNESLGELSIDDTEGLTETEKRATVEDLLVSRSGIYHRSAFEPASMKRNRPERGSHEPGEHWFYNNWDFNLVAHLIEKAGGASVAVQFRDRVAEPLGMQDFSVGDVFEFEEPSHSRYPAIVFRMSARDLARVGQAYLDGGSWNGTRIVSDEWIEATWTAHAVIDGEGNGFGYLWWIYPAKESATAAVDGVDGFVTRGAGGQVLAVIPSLDLVYVHLTDTENGMGRDFSNAIRVLNAVLEAHEGDADQKVAVKPPDPEPLANAKPAPPRRLAVEWPSDLFFEIQGTYSLGPQITIDVHEYDDRLFGLPKGVPLAEVELFVEDEGVIFSPAVDLVLEVVRNEEGEINALEGRMDGRPVRIEKTGSQE